MNLWADLETPLAEEPLFHIDERDRDPASEDDRQAEFVKRARAAGLRVAAVPNERQWGMKAWNRAKRLGAWWGFGDTIVFARERRVAVLEWKNGTRMPEQHQVDCLNALHRMGFPVGVFRRADSALAWLRAQGFPAGGCRAA
jgi:hypothetical protein